MAKRLGAFTRARLVQIVQRFKQRAITHQDVILCGSYKGTVLWDYDIVRYVAGLSIGSTGYVDYDSEYVQLLLKEAQDGINSATN